MGYRPFREAVAAYLRTARGVRCEADQVMVVSGSQQALEIAARVLFEPGAAGLGRGAGLRRGAGRPRPWRAPGWCPSPVDDAGLDVSAGIAREPEARGAVRHALAPVPARRHHDAPRGGLQLLDWARRCGRLDHRGRLRQRVPLREPAHRLAAGARPRLRASSTSAPSARSSSPRCASATSWSRPTSSRASRRCARRWTSARRRSPRRCWPTSSAKGTSAATCAGCACSMRNGARRSSTRWPGSSRQLQVIGDAAGMHLVATLPEGARDRDLALRAAGQGLWTMPLSACYLGPPGRPASSWATAASPSARSAKASSCSRLSSDGTATRGASRPARRPSRSTAAARAAHPPSP